MGQETRLAAHTPEITFGPVPSRRLGRSLGINNILPKYCTYSCVYCQLGRTSHLSVTRRQFHDPEIIRLAVQNRLDVLQTSGERVDYLTLVPDGEPTLDSRLGETIDALRPFGIPLAVITNCSLLWHPDVSRALKKADWVSLKVDAVDQEQWRRVDRPHRKLNHSLVLEAARQFAGDFHGRLFTETMLICGINDSERSLQALAPFLGGLAPHTAYLSVPTRPPAEPWVQIPQPSVLLRAYHCLSEAVPRVELLTGYEGSDFATTGQAEHDVLAITSVHPMRQDAVLQLLERAGADPTLLLDMERSGRLCRSEYQGHTYYLRNLSRAR